MSNEEIIRKWKTERSKDSTKSPASDESPTNPAGDSELDDESLERIAGGSSEYFLSLGCCPGTLEN